MDSNQMLYPNQCYPGGFFNPLAGAPADSHPGAFCSKAASPDANAETAFRQACRQQPVTHPSPNSTAGETLSGANGPQELTAGESHGQRSLRTLMPTSQAVKFDPTWYLSNTFTPLSSADEILDILQGKVSSQPQATLPSATKNCTDLFGHQSSPRSGFSNTLTNSSTVDPKELQIGLELEQASRTGYTSFLPDALISKPQPPAVQTEPVGLDYPPLLNIPASELYMGTNSIFSHPSNASSVQTQQGDVSTAPLSRRNTSSPSSSSSSSSLSDWSYSGSSSLSASPALSAYDSQFLQSLFPPAYLGPPLSQTLSTQNSNPPKFFCHKCGKGHTRQSNLLAHLRDTHSTAKKVFCDVEGCTKSYKRVSECRRHKKDLHGIPLPSEMAGKVRKSRRVANGDLASMMKVLR